MAVRVHTGRLLGRWGAGRRRRLVGLLGVILYLLIVPCHRVVGADGSLTGYAGGLSRKRYLLALEGSVDGVIL